MEMFLQASDRASQRHESRQELFRERTIHNKHNRPAKVKALYQRRVKLWIGFLVNTGRVPDSYEIKKGSPAPDVNLIKAFIRWYVFHARRGARTGVLPSMRSVLWIRDDLRFIDLRSSRRAARHDCSASRVSEAAEEAHIAAALRLVSLE
ncbi:uncharacterized protein N7458_002493 [Penicillium daleae]|uniref:Uncharacterized protein n=1 Tax=Penicillium daleae TaxID=63821 RepID=A0AAD6G6A4_9EURO|nr:uncharacterized protein N7458_002493 [Penicillium daleae]KAJ5460941.1 hypothetical protein N7458_002493 [Penicillium daleae]